MGIAQDRIPSLRPGAPFLWAGMMALPLLECHLLPMLTTTLSQIAEALTLILGREIIHQSLPEAEFSELLVKKTGMPEEFASMLSAMEVDVKNGSQEILSSSVEDVTGQAPISFGDFAAREKHHWA